MRSSSFVFFTLPPVWYSVTRVSKKFFSLRRTTLALLADSSGQAKAFFKLPNTPSATCQITARAGSGSHVANVTFTARIDPGTTTHYKDPFDPSDMVATLNPDGSVDASWTNNTDPADDAPIEVRYRGPGGTWIVALTVPAGTSSVHVPAPAR